MVKWLLLWESWCVLIRVVMKCCFLKPETYQKRGNGEIFSCVSRCYLHQIPLLSILSFLLKLFFPTFSRPSSRTITFKRVEILVWQALRWFHNWFSHTFTASRNIMLEIPYISLIMPYIVLNKILSIYGTPEFSCSLHTTSQQCTRYIILSVLNYKFSTTFQRKKPSLFSSCIFLSNFQYSYRHFLKMRCFSFSVPSSHMVGENHNAKKRLCRWLTCFITNTNWLTVTEYLLVVL